MKKQRKQYSHDVGAFQVSFGRFMERRRTPSSCRSARLFKWSSVRDLKASDAVPGSARSILRVACRTW